MEQPEQADPRPRLEEQPTVLVIDDDADLRAVMVAVLEEGGYRVAEARNGQEALDRIAEGVRPAVVLLDLKMPVMGGRELLAARRQIAQLERVPIVVTTAYPFLLEERPLGAMVLEKPFHIDELLAVVGALIPRH